MTANDWLVIQRARARRDGVRLGALLAAPIALALGITIMLGIHVALSMYADRSHESALTTIREADALLLTDCRKDLARYNDVAQLERDAVAAMERRP